MKIVLQVSDNQSIILELTSDVVKRKVIFIVISFSGEIQTRSRLLSSADGRLLEVYWQSHRPPTGLQVQRPRDGHALSATQPLNRRPCGRWSHEYAVAANRNVVR